MTTTQRLLRFVARITPPLASHPQPESMAPRRKRPWCLFSWVSAHRQLSVAGLVDGPLAHWHTGSDAAVARRGARRAWCRHALRTRCVVPHSRARARPSQPPLIFRGVWPCCSLFLRVERRCSRATHGHLPRPAARGTPESRGSGQPKEATLAPDAPFTCVPPRACRACVFACVRTVPATSRAGS